MSRLASGTAIGLPVAHRNKSSIAFARVLSHAPFTVATVFVALPASRRLLAI